jgi:hypothetical protein
LIIVTDHWRKGATGFEVVNEALVVLASAWVLDVGCIL